MATRSERDASFGAHLRRLRIAAGLTQEALAERAELSLNAISALERGERRHPYPRTVQVLAGALGLADAERAALVASIARRPAAITHAPVTQTPLPDPVTSLVGRQEEVAKGVQLILQGNVRMLTLTGPGGVGKSRLALRIASELDAAFADGVAFVPLASVKDPALVIPAIAQGVGLLGPPGTGRRELLVRHLGSRHLLLVLDNVEQVVEASAELADLLVMCPHLTMLVTSRISLRVDGEHLFPVPPLPVHAPGAGSSWPDPTGAPAVRLFVQRAQAVRSGFALSPENSDAVADICIRLDGIPLAIELAAAWIRVLSPQAILGNLGRRLDLLTGGGRDRPERLQTMRAAIEWSYDHLPPAGQRVFRRLAVCSGGCELEAAAAIVQFEDELEPAGLVEARTRQPRSPGDVSFLSSLATLVDHSLALLTDGPAGESRIGMLETIREFGIERLEEAEEAKAVRKVHAHHFLAIASKARQGLEGPYRRASHARVQREIDNLRAALAWFLETGDAEGAQRLASEMARFWTNSGSIAEGRAWMAQVLSLTGASSAQTRFDALYWMSILALLQEEFGEAAGWAEASLDLARAHDNPLGAGMALVHLGEIIGHEDPDRAGELIEEGLRLFEPLDAPFRMATAYRQLGELAHRRGDFAQAAQHHTTALRIWTEIDHPWGVPISLRSLGEAALESGDLLSAHTAFRQSLERWRDLGERLPISDCLSGLARVALASGQEDTAILLLSAQDRLDRDMGYVQSRDLRVDLKERARLVAGADRFDDIWQRGQLRSPDAVLDEALALPPPA